MALNVNQIRAQFPALAITDAGKNRVYLDSPGGTQVPQLVIDSITECLIGANANLGGPFVTSEKAGTIVDEAHTAMVDFLNASSEQEVIFGQNMTSLTFNIARSLTRLLMDKDEGGEIILSKMDHEGNISPWLMMAEDLGFTVKWMEFPSDSYEYDLSQLDGLVNDKTRFVALGYASNLIGTINDVTAATARIKSINTDCLVFIDAVQYAPHRIIDVQAVGCDFLACSPYKFFGPHMGVLWGRKKLLTLLESYRVRPAGEALPGKFETGTLSHEAMAGVSGAVEYLASIGRDMGQEYLSNYDGVSKRRQELSAGFDAMSDYEDGLAIRLIDGLQKIEGITVHGITNPNAVARRVPTVSFTSDRRDPSFIAKALGQKNIFVWSGDNYAIEIVKQLGLVESGGVLRIGIAHYNTAEEIDVILSAISEALD